MESVFAWLVGVEFKCILRLFDDSISACARLILRFEVESIDTAPPL